MALTGERTTLKIPKFEKIIFQTHFRFGRIQNFKKVDIPFSKPLKVLVSSKTPGKLSDAL